MEAWQGRCYPCRILGKAACAHENGYVPPSPKSGHPAKLSIQFFQFHVWHQFAEKLRRDGLCSVSHIHFLKRCAGGRFPTDNDTFCFSREERQGI